MIPRLHVVTDDSVLGRSDFMARAGEVLDACAATPIALHLRGPRSTGRLIFDLAQALRSPAEPSGSRLLVNDRVDVALALGLDGAHLGRRSLPIGDVRGLLGPDRLVGASVHGLEEGVEAERAGADLLFVGTLWPSASHPGVELQGVGLMSDMAAAVSIPLLGIGGVTPERVASILSAGGHGAAVLGGIWYAPSSGDAVQAYLRALDASTLVSSDASRP